MVLVHGFWAACKDAFWAECSFQQGRVNYIHWSTRLARTSKENAELLGFRNAHAQGLKALTLKAMLITGLCYSMGSMVTAYLPCTDQLAGFASLVDHDTP